MVIKFIKFHFIILNEQFIKLVMINQYLITFKIHFIYN